MNLESMPQLRCSYARRPFDKVIRKGSHPENTWRCKVCGYVIADAIMKRCRYDYGCPRCRSSFDIFSFSPASSAKDSGIPFYDASPPHAANEENEETYYVKEYGYTQTTRLALAEKGAVNNNGNDR